VLDEGDEDAAQGVVAAQPLAQGGGVLAQGLLAARRRRAGGGAGGGAVSERSSGADMGADYSKPVHGSKAQTGHCLGAALSDPFSLHRHIKKKS